MAGSAWLVNHGALSDPRLRLFCFPFAGGGASAFRRWPAALPAGIEVLAAQLPGRETRFVEPPLRDLDSVLARLVLALEPLLDRPFAFFGHSLGALVAFELTRALRRRRLPLPRHMFVSGRRAPQIPIGRREFQNLPDDELIGEIRKLSGTAEGVLQNDELMALVLPMMRADFAVHDTYRHREDAPLDVPLSVFGGLDDIATDAENLAAWHATSTRDVRVSLFKGGHFFIEESRDEVLSAVARDLGPLLELRSRTSAVA